MSEWLLQIVLILLGLLLFGGLIYSLLFSPKARERATEPKPEFNRYDRREAERNDRRRSRGPAPGDVGERRQGPRRTDE